MQFVLVLTWHDGDQVHSQAYGTWDVREDGSHLAEVAAFARERLVDRHLISAMMYALDPVAT
jgi:hypothetical protein